MVPPGYANLTVLDHPLVGDLLARLRDRDTVPAAFRAASHRLGLLLVTEATRGLPTQPVEVVTPVGHASGRRVQAPPVVVPVLRAGLGLVPAVTSLYPDAPIGALGLERDETTHQAVEYYRRIPDAQGAHGLILEPMLATGGSAAHAVAALRAAGADAITVVVVVAAPPGLERLAAEHPEASVVAAAVDDGLDDRAFIVPGLGDFGDRLLGTT